MKKEEVSEQVKTSDEDDAAQFVEGPWTAELLRIKELTAVKSLDPADQNIIKGIVASSTIMLNTFFVHALIPRV